MRTQFGLIGLFFGLLVACKDGGGEDGPDDGSIPDTDDPGPTPLTATVAPSPYVPAVAIVSFSGEGTGSVEFGLAGAFNRVSPVSQGTVHDLALIGLKAGQTYDWRAVLVTPEGERRESAAGTFAVPPSPAPAVTVSVGDGSSFDGNLMVSMIDRTADTSWLTFVDADGDVVWWVETVGNGIISARFGNNGTSVLYGEYANDEAIDSGHVVRVGMDGRSRISTRVLRGHHDFVEMPDGQISFVSFEVRDFVMPDVTEPVTFGTDTIRKGPEGMTDADAPAVIFNNFDDYTASTPGFVCSHVEPTTENIGPKLGETGVLEWSHANSLVYLEAENAYYLNARYTDWLLKIDATSGAVLWELNGTGASGDFVNDVLWSHPHLSDVWDGGALVFDNGDHHVPAESRIIQVSWDEVARTAQVDWIIDGPPGFVSAIGDARRMPDGRILGVWGNLGLMTVYQADGTLDWQADIGSPRFAARARYAADLYALPNED